MRSKVIFLTAAMTAALVALPLLKADDAPAVSSNSAVPATALSTQPDQAAPSSVRSGSGPLRRFLQRWRNNGGGLLQPATPADWEQLDKFLAQNAPQQFAVMQELKLNHNSPIYIEMMHRWRNYQLLLVRFPDVADVHLQRFEADDHLFGLVKEAHKYPSKSEELRSDIEKTTRYLADLNIHEEQLRVMKLEALLDQEKQQFALDKDQEEELIRTRTNRIMNSVYDRSTTRPTDASPSTDNAAGN